MEHEQHKIPLQEFTNVDKNKFLQEIYPMRKPVVLKGLDLGVCKSRWTVDYLSKTGGDQEVKIHVSEVPQMDFIQKNFMYRTLPFDQFVQRVAENKHKEYFISEDEKYYLRSLGEDPRKVEDKCRRDYKIMILPTSVDSFPGWPLTSRSLNSLTRISSSPVCSASAHWVCSSGHTMM